MSERPSISVLICCHNGERYLGETLDSVLAQTIPPLEVIVVDDGSTDRSAAIAKAVGEPVRVIQQTQRGLPASRNVAVAAATGEYVFFIDSDDLLHPESFERLAAAAASNEHAVAIMGFAAFREDVTRPFSVVKFDQKTFFPSIIGGNFGPQHNRLIRRTLVLRAGGFDPTMFLFEDWLFWCRVALCDAVLAPVDFVGAYYRRHDATMSDTAPSIAAIKGHVRVMEELGEGMLRRPDLVSMYGEALFWSCWTALHRARQHGVLWRDLRRLGAVINEVARRGPESFRRSRFASLVRLVGAHWAERLRASVASNLFQKNPAAPQPHS